MKTLTLKHTISATETALAMGSGGLEVWATPAMICLMESAAYQLAQQEGAETVGTKVDIAHLKACLPGEEVEAEAKLTEVDGRKMTFEVTVKDAKGQILGQGTQERFSIDPERFMAKLK